MSGLAFDAARLAAHPLTWIAIWVIAAGALSALPSRRHHWPLAYVLMAVGAPILVWAFAVDPVAGVVGLAAGALVLRWPLVRAVRRVRGRG